MKNNFSNLDWKKGDGLLPVIIQNVSTRQVLMLGYMNEESFQKTQDTRKVWFFGRSKNRLWMKGEESGNELKVEEIFVDCDNDTLLIKVRPSGATCHTGAISCFSNEKESDEMSELYETIQRRKETMPKDSYTASLFAEGLEKICAKVEEESEEVIWAAKTETRLRLIEESVDVLYHLFLLLVEKEI